MRTAQTAWITGIARAASSFPVLIIALEEELCPSQPPLPGSAMQRALPMATSPSVAKFGWEPSTSGQAHLPPAQLQMCCTHPQPQI